MDWIILAIATAFFYGAYNVAIKLSSSGIHQILGAVILQVVAVLVGGVLLVWLKIGGQSFFVSNKGIFYAVLAGVFVGLSEILAFYLFSKGISVSLGAPVIIGGSVVFAVLLGLFIGEKINFYQILAICLIMVGVIILSRK